MAGRDSGAVGPLPDATTTTRAVVAYCATSLGIPSAVTEDSAVTALPMLSWSVGALVPLPIEYSAWGAPAPVVNTALLTQLAAAYDPGTDGLIDLCAAPLVFSDAAADRRAATAALTGVGSCRDRWCSSRASTPRPA